ncbi:hypothetical protein BVZ93_00008B, partial [Haemophilus influenzae]
TSFTKLGWFFKLFPSAAALS